jgi:transcription termination factor Rho
MENPPSKEESASPTPAVPEKKTARPRTRTAKPRVSKTKPAGKKTAQESAPAEAKAETPVHVEKPAAPAPVEPSRSEPSPESIKDARAERSSDNSNDDSRAEQSEHSRDQNSQGDQNNQGDLGNRGDRGDRGDRQHNGGGGGGGQQDFGRGSWKRNKRKRGGRQGNWQPSGNNAPAHPPQPAPAQAPQISGDLPNPAAFEDLVALDALAAEISSGSESPLFLDEIYAKNLADLTAFAREHGATFEGAPNRVQLILRIFAAVTESKRPLHDRGYIDINADGAFIVHRHVNYRLYPEDPYLPESLIKRYGLKRGHEVEVLVRVPEGQERCPVVLRIERVMGMAPDEISKVTPFEELVPYYPLERILLEAPDVQKDVSMRAVDILTPIGFGQRGLIVAPPRTGKTILLQNIANSVSENFPDYTLILLLIDERPEEVTDFKRHTKGEVVSSTFDESPESHVHCAEMVGEKARRLVEQGKHVVILLDSITRLARAYNALTGNQGKTMSGGLESNALQKPKRFFGAARNIEGAGSLTIIGTALVDTGSRMDEIIFEEFKGTGNMELHLDRGLVERRIFPAINIDRSGTRKEELIYHPEELQKIYGLRRAMQGLGPIESMEMLITRLKKTKSNAEFLLSLR